MNRRSLLARGFALGPIASIWLSACGDEAAWPEGMLPFKWDRDTCVRCSMAISDRRFAAQIRGGDKNTAFKFDDIGCAATFRAEKLKQHPWMTDAGTRFWVADFSGKGDKWIDARQAHYLDGKTSPMGYNHAAFATPQPGSVGFEALCAKLVATWPANCKPSEAAARAASNSKEPTAIP